MRPRVRLVALLGTGIVPWVVVLGQGPGASVSLVFSFGLLNPTPLHLTPLPTYLLVLSRGLPDSLLAWPVAVLLFGLAAVSAAGAVLVHREDRRVTGGLLVLAGVSLLPVTGAVGRPPGVTAVPVGLAALWGLAWIAYGDDLSGIIGRGAGRER